MAHPVLVLIQLELPQPSNSGGDFDVGGWYLWGFPDMRVFQKGCAIMEHWNINEEFFTINGT